MGEGRVVVALIGNVGKYFGVKLDCGRRINTREQFKDHHNYSQGPWVGSGMKGKFRLGRGNGWDMAAGRGRQCRRREGGDGR